MANETDDKRLNPEIKAKWLAALRSGKYEQGQSQLRPTDTEFCCLGVLCDLLNPHWDKRPTGDGYNHASGGVMFTSTPVRVTAGLSTNAESQLMKMNDDGISFAQIADYIEAKL